MTRVFRFTWEQETWRLNDLKGLEIEALEKLLEKNYIGFQPGISARDTFAILATFLSRSRPEDEVAAIIENASWDDLAECWTFEEDDLPTEFADGIPKSGPADTSTTIGRSGVPGSSTGLPTLPNSSPSET